MAPTTVAPAGTNLPAEGQRRAAQNSRARRIVSRVTGAVTMLIVAIFLLAAAAVGSGQWQAHPVLSGSMEPHLPTGSIVLTKATDVDDLEVGDVAMFQAPEDASNITHRITDIEHTADGDLLLTTKGDANDTEDPWRVIVEEDFVWVAEGDVPYAGYAVAAAKSPTGVRVLLTTAGLALLGASAAMVRRSLRNEEATEDQADAPTESAHTLT